MKSTTIVTLAAAVTVAHAEPVGSLTNTEVSADIKAGQNTITITVEKDGKKETRTLTIDPNTPLPQLTEQIAEKLGGTGLATPPTAPAPKVTYLGVMLSEPDTGFGAGAGGGDSGGGAEGLGGLGGGQPGAGQPAASGLPAGTGLTVTGVTPDSPAAKAGLQAGDVLAKLNDQVLVNNGQFTTLVRNMKEGDVVKLAVVRNGEARDVEATLASRTDDLVLSTLGRVEYKPFNLDRTLDLRFNSGRLLTIDPQGNVIEASPDSLVPPAPPQPPGAPVPPEPATRPTTPNPAWETAIREALAAKDKAASHWQEQLSKWRAEWTENQKRATDEYRKAMEKMGDELAKAREAAEKAREEARRAVEEVMRKIEEDKAKSVPQPESAPEPAEPEPPKNA